MRLPASASWICLEADKSNSPVRIDICKWPSPHMLSPEDQRSRDEIAFDGFPPSDFITVGDSDIRVRVAYSEELSGTLRSIGGGKWDPDQAEWVFPFSAWRKIASQVDTIDALARKAKQHRQAETEAREAERVRRETARHEERLKKAKAAAALRPCSMKQAHAKGIVGRPLFHIELESIGDPVANGTASFGFPSRAFVSQVVGHDGRKLVFARLQGCRDYSRANSAGSRGIFISYQLEEGPIYYVSSPRTWRSRDTYYCTIENGHLRRMTDEEVMQCLER